MISNLIGGFIAILIGVSLTGPIASEIGTKTATTNASGNACTWAVDSAYAPCQLYFSSSWGTTVLRMVPGFFALGVLGIGIAVTYSSLREAGIV
jgi:hypothetical protein